MSYRPRVVILGAGFGGLWAAKKLRNKPVDVLVIDRNNFHTFLPLLYQVAAAEIEIEQIAYPVRQMFRKSKNVGFIKAEVLQVIPEENLVITNEGSIPYDFLIVALGSQTAFFGVSGAREYAFPLKTIPQALKLRNHILSMFEKASFELDPARRLPLLNFVIVGGGPTGVEFATSLQELIDGPLKKDFKELRPWVPQVHLIEANPKVLKGYPEDQRDYAMKELQRKGIVLHTGISVTEVTSSSVTLSNGEKIMTRTVVWAAGIQGPEILNDWHLPLNKRKQILVNKTLRTLEFENIYAIGDLAALKDQFIPQVAPAAIQMGELAAENILRTLYGKPLKLFKYKDKGSMTILGRNKAIVKTKRLKFKGFVAWLSWLFLHLMKLVGFRNRIMVLLNWAWSYLFYERASRIILTMDNSHAILAKDRSEVPEHIL
ncbi:MAG: NAD(P)/FAD-dependent oxidoreductase [Methanobacteriota archaeon]|nr:MAG: NAD(P)/FAD-dependent oxidoreductase [Euryarchaeota archaeon]